MAVPFDTMLFRTSDVGWDMGEDPPRPASLPQGYDEEAPYEEDLSAYPDWWRRNIREFREHGMRPYRPPRFNDGELVPPKVRELEGDLGVDIRIRSTNPQDGNDWELHVDDVRVKRLRRRRTGEGYSQYEMTASEFETIVREAVKGGRRD